MTPLSRALTLVGHCSDGLWRPLVRSVGTVVSLHPPRGMRQWQANAAVVLGRRPTRRETALATTSWARNLVESAQLGRWSTGRILHDLVVDDEHRDRLLRLHRDGGVVVALPHMGSWDFAGAWACASGMPVSTVAEEVPEFDWFVRAREALGFRVYGASQPRVLRQLQRDLADGRMVCLVGDRNLGSGGVPVLWPTPDGGRDVRIPGGAAHLARTTGATLVGAACHYEGDRMRLVVGEPVETSDLATMCQELADFFGTQVQRSVVDWHVLVPFFDGVVAQ